PRQPGGPGAGGRARRRARRVLRSDRLHRRAPPSGRSRCRSGGAADRAGARGDDAPHGLRAVRSDRRLHAAGALPAARCRSRRRGDPGSDAGAGRAAAGASAGRALARGARLPRPRGPRRRAPAPPRSRLLGAAALRLPGAGRLLLRALVEAGSLQPPLRRHGAAAAERADRAARRARTVRRRRALPGNDGSPQRDRRARRRRHRPPRLCRRRLGAVRADPSPRHDRRPRAAPGRRGCGADQPGPHRHRPLSSPRRPRGAPLRGDRRPAHHRRARARGRRRRPRGRSLRTPPLARPDRARHLAEPGDGSAESANGASPPARHRITFARAMPGRAWLVALAALVAATARPPASYAEAEPTGAEAGIRLEIAGACPDEAEVRRLLAQVLSPDEARAAPIAVQDLGPHYRIVVRETATTLDDPARNCAARAQQAAVIVANDLRSHPQVFGPPTWTIEKGVVFDVAPGQAGTAWAPGAEFRGALGSGRWSLVGAAGARGPATLT